MIIAGILTLAAIVALSASYLVAKQRHKAKIKLVTTCGYVAPRPSLDATGRLLKIVRRLTNIQVGPIKFVGRENYDSLRGPRIVTANHPHWADAAIMPQLVLAPARYMAHGRVMQFFGGLLGVYVSKFGVFAANDSIRDGGVRTRAAATEMLVKGETLVILPEGLTNFSPTMAAFKNGTVIIARNAAEKLGKPVNLVPTYIRYGRYPGPWLARFDRAVQFFMVFFGFPFFRRGATMVIGKPINTDELYKKPDGTLRTDDEATAILKSRIQILDPGAI
jgi:1-acyl-sn-glycerol-3-phosphate acyltransferase